MEQLFTPHSVAVIGASSNQEKIGYKIVQNIIDGGYTGALFPVNPKGGTILGHKVYETIGGVPDDVDVAVITIPALFVYDVVEQCAKKGVKNCIIITSGFAEVGNRKEEEKIVAVAREHGMRVLGPNVFGIYVGQSKLNATFGPKNIRPGNIAIITQSGALGIAMTGKAASENIGISSIISVGNKADIDEADLLEFLKKDAYTRVILMYIEGFKNGEHFINTVKNLPEGKHVVVIKAGASKRGAIAAASHTGSLAGSNRVFSGIAQQMGLMRTENIRLAFDVSRFLASASSPKGEQVVVVTNGGGIGVMCADACEKYGVKLLDDMDVLRGVFKEIIPEFGSYKNPVDLTGQATAEDYRNALMKAYESEAIHAVISLFCETALFNRTEIVEMIKGINSVYRREKPIVFSLFGGEQIDVAIEHLRAEGINCFDEVYDAVAVMGTLYKRYAFIGEQKQEQLVDFPNENRVREIIKKSIDEKREMLLPHEAKEILQLAGLEVPPYGVARTLDEAISLAESIGYPTVMKIVSEDIIHKTEAGGIALNLENKEEIINAYQGIIKNASHHFPDARIRGVEVSKMLAKGVETIVGGTQEPTYGPVVMFGLGGIYVEALGDVVFRAAPVDIREARRMINEISASSLLHGVRGEKRKDIEQISDTIVKVSVLLSTIREIRDIEINPLMVYEYGKGVKVVDARVLVRG